MKKTKRLISLEKQRAPQDGPELNFTIHVTQAGEPNEFFINGWPVSEDQYSSLAAKTPKGEPVNITVNLVDHKEVKNDPIK